MNNIIIQPGVLDRLADQVPRAHSYAVISDSNVAKLYGRRVAHQLTNSHLLEFPAGEANKTRATWSTLSDQMLERGFGRDCCVIALGGGVTGDLAGFVAATYMRGVPVVQVPTSLLAMVDAAIGGKVGVDTDAGKNLIGAFHEPARVCIDPGVLATLPDVELRSGLVETIKHGAIADAAYLKWIMESADAIFDRRRDSLESLIRTSVEIKLDHVNEDPHEQGKRAALNFGHTIGHALERLFEYRISHGEAVAMGMFAELEIGIGAGITNPEARDAVWSALAATRTLFDQTISFHIDDIVAATHSDKKNRSGMVRYTLLRKIGEVARSEAGEWTLPLRDDVVMKALMASLNV